MDQAPEWNPRDLLDRREFAGLLPALLALGTLAVEAEAQTPSPSTHAALPTIASGVFKPKPSTRAAADPPHMRDSRSYLAGTLKAGNIRLEMHQTVQQPGAEHEAIGTHLHNEIWCVREGVATLFINGTEHRMEAGDVGLVCAGDTHWIKNAGDGILSYFVIAVGPPE